MNFKRMSIAVTCFSLAVALATCRFACAQETPIKVLFLDGNSGHPLKNIHVIVRDGSRSAQQLELRTDSNGMSATTVQLGAPFTAFAERSFIRTCEDGSLASQHSFDAEQIVMIGISEKSTCKTHTPPAQPGVLIRIIRRSTFLEALGEN